MRLRALEWSWQSSKKKNILSSPFNQAQFYEVEETGHDLPLEGLFE